MKYDKVPKTEREAQLDRVIDQIDGGYMSLEMGLCLLDTSRDRERDQQTACVRRLKRWDDFLSGVITGFIAGVAMCCVISLFRR